MVRRRHVTGEGHNGNNVTVTTAVVLTGKLPLHFVLMMHVLHCLLKSLSYSTLEIRLLLLLLLLLLILLNCQNAILPILQGFVPEVIMMTAP